MTRRRIVLLVLLASVLLGLAVFAEKQLWFDQQLTSGWHLQRQVVTGRCRVLDPGNTTVESGFGQACDARFDAVLTGQAGEGPAVEEIVLLLHGLGRSAAMFDDLAPALATEGRLVVALEYPSLLRSLDEHGEWLNGLLDGPVGAKKVSFVTHSLGGLVVRQALAARPAWRDRLQLGRVVMLAPPNQGAEITQILDRWTPARWVLGPSFAEIAELALPAPLPKGTELAVLAGGAGHEEGYNGLLPGDDDGLLRVAETKHPGATGHFTVRSLHTYIAAQPETLAIVRRFLDTGRLPAAETR